jgi:hypothetical protein
MPTEIALADGDKQGPVREEDQLAAAKPFERRHTASMTAAKLAHALASPNNVVIRFMRLIFYLLMKRSVLSVLVGASAILLAVDAKPAGAVLAYNIFESMGDLVVETSGSLNLPAPVGNGNCGADGVIAPTSGFLCTGPDAQYPTYQISGPSTFTGTADLFPATSVSGLSTGVVALIGRFVIDSSYVSGSSIVSSATFAGKSLADLGLTPSSGTLGTWTVAGTGDTISINVVPGPLPVLGAGAAFGFSRQLRKRIKSRQTPAQN